MIEPFWIVLSWMETSVRAVPGTGRPDLGYPAETRIEYAPGAVVWLRDGRWPDVERAQAFADDKLREHECVSVLVLPADHDDPLGHAREQVRREFVKQQNQVRRPGGNERQER